MRPDLHKSRPPSRRRPWSSAQILESINSPPNPQIHPGVGTGSRVAGLALAVGDAISRWCSSQRPPSPLMKPTMMQTNRPALQGLRREPNPARAALRRRRIPQPQLFLTVEMLCRGRIRRRRRLSGMYSSEGGRETKPSAWDLWSQQFVGTGTSTRTWFQEKILTVHLFGLLGAAPTASAPWKLDPKQTGISGLASQIQFIGALHETVLATRIWAVGASPSRCRFRTSSLPKYPPTRLHTTPKMP